MYTRQEQPFAALQVQAIGSQQTVCACYGSRVLWMHKMPKRSVDHNWERAKEIFLRGKIISEIVPSVLNPWTETAT